MLRGYALDLAENQVVLLKNVEELTHYIFELNKKLEAQEKAIMDQRREILHLRKLDR